MLLDGWIGALSKVLGLYMVKRRSPLTPLAAKYHDHQGRWFLGTKLPSMFWLVVVLLRKCVDQLKIEWT